MLTREERLLNVVSDLMDIKTYPVSPERDSYIRRLQRELTRVMRHPSQPSKGQK